MNIKLGKLTNSLSAIKKLSNTDLGSPAINFKLMGVVEKIEQESKKFVELQKGIVDKYRDNSVQDKIYIPIESINKFNREMQEASEIEIELEWTPIDCSLDALIGFTANDMQALNGILINIKGE